MGIQFLMFSKKKGKIKTSKNASMVAVLTVCSMAPVLQTLMLPVCWKGSPKNSSQIIF